MFKMESWLMFAILALIIWGFWGFFPKIAVKHIDPKSALVWEVVGALVIGIFILFMIGFQPAISAKGVTFAILAGAAASIGGLFFLYAVSKGKLSVVVTMTALYPLITILLSFFILNEAITLKQGFGIFFSLIAIFLLSS